jgi:hypothetical protein
LYDGTYTTIDLNFSSAWGGGFNLVNPFDYDLVHFQRGNTLSFQTQNSVHVDGMEIWVRGLSISTYDWQHTFFKDIYNPLSIIDWR